MSAPPAPVAAAAPPGPREPTEEERRQLADLAARIEKLEKRAPREFPVRLQATTPCPTPGCDIPADWLHRVSYGVSTAVSRPRRFIRVSTRGDADGARWARVACPRHGVQEVAVCARCHRRGSEESPRVRIVGELRAQVDARKLRLVWVGTEGYAMDERVCVRCAPLVHATKERGRLLHALRSGKTVEALIEEDRDLNKLLRRTRRPTWTPPPPPPPPPEASA